MLTYYWPLPATDTVASRKKLHSQSREDWCEKIVADLQQAHPQILPQIQRLDVCFWGHAMIRPSVDFLFNPQRSQALPQAPGMFFAGADVSGMPFFEEAHYQGVAAAEAILRETTGTVASIL